MSDQRHAPGWRGRARRTGPIVSDLDQPFWLQCLEAIAPVGCVVVSLAAMALAAYAWGVDYLAGHL